MDGSFNEFIETELALGQNAYGHEYDLVVMIGERARNLDTSASTYIQVYIENCSEDIKRRGKNALDKLKEGKREDVQNFIESTIDSAEENIKPLGRLALSNLDQIEDILRKMAALPIKK